MSSESEFKVREHEARGAMQDRPKFAVVREDARLEALLLDSMGDGPKQALVVASGGCTALELAARPDTRATAFDLNPRQLALIDAKIEAVAAGQLARLSVEDANPDAINQRGEFEGLFRVLRRFIEEFIAPAHAVEAWFADPAPASRRATLAAWGASPYWSAAFAVAFADPFLHAMFGPEATQHAAPGTYALYFQRAFERGMTNPDGARNPFIQHVFLGRYLDADAPPYTRAARRLEVEKVLGGLLSVPDLERFDLFSLSNVFDWSDDALVTLWIDTLRQRAKDGAAVLLRQLNNDRPLELFFGQDFEIHEALGQELQAAERSLFYNKVVVATRRARTR